VPHSHGIVTSEVDACSVQSMNIQLHMIASICISVDYARMLAYAVHAVAHKVPAC
jgi:hypothetical protein